MSAFVFVLFLLFISAISARFSVVYFRAIKSGSLSAITVQNQNTEKLLKISKLVLITYELISGISGFFVTIGAYSLVILTFLKYDWIFALISLLVLFFASFISPFVISLCNDKWLVFKIAQWKFPLDIFVGISILFLFLDYF